MRLPLRLPEAVPSPDAYRPPMPTLLALSTGPLEGLKPEMIQVQAWVVVVSRPGESMPLRLNHSTHGAEKMRPVSFKVYPLPRDPRANERLPDFWRLEIKLEA